jgi:dipeptidase E
MSITRKSEPQMTETRRLLLISNSTLHGSGFLDHAESEIRDFLRNIQRILFVPFALHDRDGYAAKVTSRLAKMADQRQSVSDAEAIFIGGGNTFRLLKTLYDFDLLTLIRQRVDGGTLYMGSSAGSNVAAPTIRTTNDMPIVEPPSFDALGLVPFQINPHYLDADPTSTHMGETREERIVQFLEENDVPVVGLREGSMVRVEGNTTTLKGSTGARIFLKGREPIEVRPGADLNEVLAPTL